MLDKKYYPLILSIARKAILEEFVGRPLIDKQALYEKYPFFREKAAVFVTLNKRRGGTGDLVLRGCIGSILPTRPFLEDLIHNAKAAAFHDYRFPPLTREEFDEVEIEVSILSLPKEVHYEDPEELRQIIRPYVHGVILTLGYNRATFLPDVWEKLPDFDLFFEHLCKKAGLPGDCLKYKPKIEIYTVQKISE